MLGVSTATQLAERGVAVTLITDGPLASGASGRSLSWLNSFTERTAAYHRLRMIGIDRYRTLAAALPDAPWLRFDGGVFWGDDAEAIAARHRAAGYKVRPVGRVPGVDVPPGGAFLNPGEGGWTSVADPAPGGPVHRSRRTADHRGGRCPAGRPEWSGLGVHLADGSTIAADAVVVATGAAVPGMLAELGVPILAQDSPARARAHRGRRRPADRGQRAAGIVLGAFADRLGQGTEWRTPGWPCVYTIGLSSGPTLIRTSAGGADDARVGGGARGDRRGGGRRRWSSGSAAARRRADRRRRTTSRYSAASTGWRACPSRSPTAGRRWA